MRTFLALLAAFLAAPVLAPAPAARAADLAPSCAPLADPLAASRSCVVAGTFPESDSQVCFDLPGKSACVARADRIAVAPDGTFELGGQRYGGAPAGAAFCAAVRLDLPHGTVVTGRGLRPNGGAASAVDRFRSPAEPAPEAPILFAPQPAPAPAQ